MLTVHHLGVSQSERIVWLCEELGIPYELVRYDRDPASGLAPAPYKALHPYGTAPVITDGDVTLGESAAIIEYIIGKYGNGRFTVCPDDPGFADYLYWFHFANGSLMPSIMTEMVVNLITKGEAVGAARALTARSDRAFQMIDQRLGEASFFAGTDLTAADIIMVFALTTMRLFVPRDLAPYPNIRAYLQRIAERPAYQRAMSKADPDLPLQLG